MKAEAPPPEACPPTKFWFEEQPELVIIYQPLQIPQTAAGRAPWSP